MRSNGSASPTEVGGDPPGLLAQGWRLWLPLGVILLTLAAFIAVPIWGERVARPHHFELRHVAEPGRTLVTRIHVALAIEGAALHNLAGSRDSALVQRYQSARASEQSAYESLRPLAMRLGSVVALRFAELDTLQSEWHRHVTEDLAQPGSAASRRDELYEEVLLSAARLDEAISGAAQARRAVIGNAERVQRRTTLGLVAAALLAASMVIVLGTRLQAYAIEAERGRVALQREAEMRERLMRGISHDLKNPITAIDGHAYLLGEQMLGELTERQQDSVVRIRRSVQSLLALIEDLLELSRVDSGQLRLSLAPIDIPGIVDDVTAGFHGSAMAAGQSLRVERDEDVPEIVTDGARVRQILENLVSNAIKYTPADGTIVVRAARAPSRSGWVVIEVDDSGPGIPTMARETIFGEFTRLAEHSAKPGAGLGLSIARRIARLLGGDIEVGTSDLGGAKFTLFLRARAPTHTRTIGGAASG